MLGLAVWDIRLDPQAQHLGVEGTSPGLIVDEDFRDSDAHGMSSLSADWLRFVPPGPLSRLLARSIGCVPKTLTDLDRSGLAGAVGGCRSSLGERQRHA